MEQAAPEDRSSAVPERRDQLEPPQSVSPPRTLEVGLSRRPAQQPAETGENREPTTARAVATPPTRRLRRAGRIPHTQQVRHTAGLAERSARAELQPPEVQAATRQAILRLPRPRPAPQWKLLIQRSAVREVARFLDKAQQTEVPEAMRVLRPKVRWQALVPERRIPMPTEAWVDSSVARASSPVMAEQPRLARMALIPVAAIWWCRPMHTAEAAVAHITAQTEAMVQVLTSVATIPDPDPLSLMARPAAHCIWSSTEREAMAEAVPVGRKAWPEPLLSA